MKYIHIRFGKRLTALILIAFLVCAVMPVSAANGFRYVHDPCLNPKAMRDIVADDTAIYGFRPIETGSLKLYASADWSDPQIVEQGRHDRIAYHQSIEAMYEMLRDMQAQGKTTEDIARAVSTKRNEIRLAAYADDPEGLAQIKARNLEKYGHEEGPLPDELFAQYGSWTTVMEKAFSTNAGMDACLGLYDDYYFMYATLGDVPAEITVTIPASLFCTYKKSVTVETEIISNVPNYQVSFVSDDSDIASVDANGVITGVKRGDTTVRCIVTDASGTVHTSQPCTVLVRYLPQSNCIQAIIRCTKALFSRMEALIRKIHGIILELAVANASVQDEGR